MTKSEAIKQLKNQVASKGQQASLEAVGIAITALETEKEPDTAGTVTSSKNNNPKYNDTLCCEKCQENNTKQLNRILSMLDIFVEPQAKKRNC